MKITIAGTPGSGKTTVGKAIAEKLGYNYYDVGQLRREMAEERGMSIYELNKLGETERWTDEEADARTTKIGKEEDNFIFAGRLAWHFIPDSFKLFIKCDMQEAARRVYEEKRNKETFESIEEAKEKLIRRTEQDKERYLKWYGLDHLDETHFDLVIDTTSLTPQQVIDQILNAINK